MLITKPTLSGTSNDKGYFATEAALNSAYPTGQNGWYAIVGTTDTLWVWDGDTSAWVDSGIQPTTPSLQEVTDVGSTTTNRLTIQKTTEQYRNAYDSSNYMSITTGSDGSTAFSLTGTSPTFTFSQDINITDAANINMSATSNGNGKITNVGRVTFVNNGYFGTLSGSFIGFNDSIGILFSKNIRMGDNLYHSFGSGRDYSFGYLSSTDVLQIVDGYTLGSNVRMQLDSSGNFVFGGTTASAKIHSISTTEQLRLGYNDSNYASFTVGSSGNLTIAPTGGKVLFPAGSASNPSVSFTGESDTGFYQVGTDQIGITTSGIARFFVNTLAFRSSGVGGISINNTASQSASKPGYSIRGDEDTGMYSNIANTLQWSTGGTERMLLNSTGLGIGTSSISARLNLGAGTTTVAPLKLTAGTNLTTPEDGAIEFDGTNLYITIGGTRRTINVT